MRLNKSGPILALVSFTCLSAGLLASTGVQVTVDATKQVSGPTRGRGPWPGSNSPGHSPGLPIRLELFVPSGQLSPEGTMLVDFLITNVGWDSIRLPSALSFRQPSGINRPYDLLTLWLTSDAIKKQYAKDEQTGRLFEIDAVATSAELYADSDEADTFALLPPGASMLVHASSPQLNPGGHSITAHAWLERVSNHSELVGTADSEAVRKTLTNVKRWLLGNRVTAEVRTSRRFSDLRVGNWAGRDAYLRLAHTLAHAESRKCVFPFLLTPLDAESFRFALEDSAIWQRWELAYHTGKADLSTHPALPHESERHQELQRILEKVLVVDPTKAVTRIGHFEALVGETSPKGVLRPLQVKWTEVWLPLAHEGTWVFVRNYKTGSRLGVLSLLLAAAPIALILLPTGLPQDNLTGYIVIGGGGGASLVCAIVAGLIGSRRWFLALLGPGMVLALVLFNPWYLSSPVNGQTAEVRTSPNMSGFSD